jgi:hypothetical protein
MTEVASGRAYKPTIITLDVPESFELSPEPLTPLWLAKHANS